MDYKNIKELKKNEQGQHIKVFEVTREEEEVFDINVLYQDLRQKLAPVSLLITEVDELEIKKLEIEELHESKVNEYNSYFEGEYKLALDYLEEVELADRLYEELGIKKEEEEEEEEKENDE